MAGLSPDDRAVQRAHSYLFCLFVVRRGGSRSDWFGPFWHFLAVVNHFDEHLCAQAHWAAVTDDRQAVIGMT